MEIIWVIENVKRSESFYTRQFTLLLAASVTLWKRYHPNHKTVLYIDTLTKKFYLNTPLFSLFDEIRILSYDDKINRKIFWSSSKTKIISKTKIPICVVDHDFLIFKNIDKHLNTKVLYSYDEIAHNWYPDKNCSYNQDLTTPVKRLVDKAANVSLFYLPDPKFANEYGKQTLQNHIEFTKMGIDNTNYMILSEQLMLRQILHEQKIPFKTLNKNIFNCKKIKFMDEINKQGIWNIKESLLYYKHYGVEKKDIDFKGMEYLLRCINSTQKEKWFQHKEGWLKDLKI
jgi:antitoxin component of RelBE/YafQ-DinJ toxin-antitoxin module